MPPYGPLNPNEDGSGFVVSGTGWQGSPNNTAGNRHMNIDEGTAAPSCSDVIQASGGNTVSCFVGFPDLPGDFDTITSMIVKVHPTLTDWVDDGVDLFVQAFQSDETTALSNEILVADETTTGLPKTISATLTGLTAGSKSIWDAFRLRFRQVYDQNMSPDSAFFRVCVATVEGEYAAAAAGPAPGLRTLALTGAGV